MAKSKSKPQNQTRTTARSPQKTTIANAPALPTFKPSPHPVTPAPALRQIEDRRTFHPEKQHRPALTVWGKKAPLKLINKARKAASWGNIPKQISQKRQAIINRFGEKAYSQTKAIRAFAAPLETIVCIRRKARKEVLAAKRKIGLSGKRRHPKHSWTSKIACRS